MEAMVTYVNLFMIVCVGAFLSYQLKQLSVRTARRVRADEARAARILGILADRTRDLRSALDTTRADNLSLTQLVQGRDQEVARISTLLSALPFLQEQVKHLQLGLVKQVDEANSRVLALADDRIQAQIEAQLLRRDFEFNQNYREASRTAPLGEPVEATVARAEKRRMDRLAQRRHAQAPEDGFRDYPVDQAPADAINFAPNPNDPDLPPQRGVSTILREEDPTRVNSPYMPDNLTIPELREAIASVGMSEEDILHLAERLSGTTPDSSDEAERRTSMPQ